MCGLKGMCLMMLRRHTSKPFFSAMARLQITRCLLPSVLAVALSSCASAQPVEPAKPVTPPPKEQPLPSAPVRAAPTRPEGPKLWPVTSLRGADYIDVREIARRFGLKAEWVKSKPAMTIGDKKGIRFTFEEKQRDFYFDGLRVFLGEAAIQEKDTLWLSKLDVIKTVAPLFRPADHAALLPATLPKLIVLDPGHGGIDPGAENKKVKVNEKTLSLDVALRLKKILEARGWRVLLTRTDDRELSRNKIVDLQMRADFANKQKADLFMSIHFNAADEAVRGVEVYSLPAQFMLSSGSEQKDDMTKQSFPNNRFDYANLLLGSELHRAMIGSLKASDRGYKRARWGMLRPAECPAVLVECAYLSNDAEARRAATPEYRQQIAEALAAGVQNYSDTLRTLQPKPAAPENAPVPVSQAKVPR